MRVEAPELVAALVGEHGGGQGGVLCGGHGVFFDAGEGGRGEGGLGAGVVDLFLVLGLVCELMKSKKK